MAPADNITKNRRDFLTCAVASALTPQKPKTPEELEQRAREAERRSKDLKAQSHAEWEQALTNYLDAAFVASLEMDSAEREVIGLLIMARRKGSGEVAKLAEAARKWLMSQRKEAR